MLTWLRTAHGMLAVIATALAIVATWWQLGLPRVVFSPELAPVPAGRSSAARPPATFLYNDSGGFSWYLFGPDNRLQYDIAGTLGNGAWGYIVGTYDKDAGSNNQRLYLNGARVAQMSDTLPIDLNAAALGIGRHVSGIADPFNGHIDAFRISHVQRSDGWIATTWNNMTGPGACAVAGAEEQEGGEPPPLAGASVVVCLIG
jgi:hypothetical protein